MFQSRVCAFHFPPITHRYPWKRVAISTSGSQVQQVMPEGADDSETRRILQELSGPGPLAPRARASRRTETCPFCREGFGSASLAIHVRRCRSLIPPPDDGAAAPTTTPTPVKKYHAASLVDL